MGAEVFPSGSAGVGLGTAARGADRTRGLLAEVVLRRPDSDPSRPWRRVQSSRGQATTTSCHLLPHTSFLLPAFSCPRWYLSSPAPSVSTCPPSLRESYWRRNQGRTSRLKWVGAPVSPYGPLPCSWVLCFAGVGGPAVFSGGGSHGPGVLEEQGLERRGPGDP